MKTSNKVSIFFITVSVALMLANLFFGLSAKVAQLLCGEAYAVEPNIALRSQGILTDQACGFDSDMIFVAVIVMILVAAIGSLLFGNKR